MDETLLAAYRASAYHVRLHQGGTAVIRIDQPLSAALHAMAGAARWSFITAWNPHSQPRSHAINRQAQRSLLRELRSRADVLMIQTGVGIGQDGWREPSLWVLGPSSAAMNTLAEKYQQHAYLAGQGHQPAWLCRVSTRA